MESAIEPLLLDVSTFAKSIGIGRSKAWELVSTGQIASVRVGTRRLVPREAVEQFVAGLITSAQARVDALLGAGASE